MKKVLFIQNSLLHYRIPFYNYLQKEFGDITVCHFGKASVSSEKEFKEIILKNKQLRGFHYTPGLKNICQDYDIIVGMFDLKWPNIWTLPLKLNKKKKFYFWGIGVSTNKGLDKIKYFDQIRFTIAKLARGVIFYSNYPIEKYKSYGFNEKSLFVAHNTIFSSEIHELKSFKPNKFLFFGSLTKRKKIDVLIIAFKKAINNLPENFNLEIIGEGPEKDNILRLVHKLKLEKRVIISGPIYDISAKKKCFEDAAATISPGQAGLSVLESFAYGVPFITSRDAITGGEIFNIQDGETGYFIKNEEDLSKIMIDLTKNTVRQLEMKRKCLSFYKNNRQISQMGDSFINAFKF